MVVQVVYMKPIRCLSQHSHKHLYPTNHGFGEQECAAHTMREDVFQKTSMMWRHVVAHTVPSLQNNAAGRCLILSFIC